MEDPSGLLEVLAFIDDVELDERDSSSDQTNSQASDTEEPRAKQQETALEALFRSCGLPTSATRDGVAGGRSDGATTSTSPMPTRHSSAGQNAVVPHRRRLSRTDELLYLRKKVKEMEGKLAQIRSASKRAVALPTQVVMMQGIMTEAERKEQSIALWRSMAMRQKDRRDTVESENAKLREKLRKQVRFAQSLQRLLRKRVANEAERQSPIAKRLYQEAIAAAGSRTIDPFEELAERLDALYLRTDEQDVWRITASAAKPSARCHQIMHDDKSGVYLAFRDSKLVPFDLTTTSRAMWRFYCEHGMQFSKYYDENKHTVGNTTFRSFTVEMPVKEQDRVAQVRGHYVVRKYVQDESVVLVWHAIYEPLQLSWSSSKAFVVRDVGWMVIKPVPGQTMTFVNSYSALTPEIEAPVQRVIGALTEFVMATRVDTEMRSNVLMENLLLDTALARTVDE